jgi:putative transposase
MTLPQSAVSDLLDALRAGEGVDLVRESVRIVLQELIEAEAAETIGAGRYERTEGRTTERNGHPSQGVVDQGWRPQVEDPQAARGVVLPVDPRAPPRIDQALYAVVMEAYVHGVSTRSVDDLVAALGIDTGISKSQVSRICAGWTNASTRSATGPWGTPASSTCTSTPPMSTSATTPWARSCPAPSSSPPASPLRAAARSWVSTSATAKTRRSGPRSSARSRHAGCRGAAGDLRRSTPVSSRRDPQVFSGTSWQRCRVHYMRNVFQAVIPRAHQEMVAAAFRTIFALSEPDAWVEARWDEVARHPRSGSRKLRRRCATRRSTCSRSPSSPAHWRKIWSNNPLERLNKEIKRRTNVVGIFPNDTAVIRLVGACVLRNPPDAV